MTDITYDNVATDRRDSQGLIPGVGNANVLQVLCTASIELATVVADGDTIRLGRIPSNARLAGISEASWDDLASSGAPTLDIGLASVNSNITSDADALSAGGLLATATTGSRVISEIANYGKRAWEFVSGQTSDPGGELDVYASVVDAATNTAGTLSVTVYGYLD